MQLVPFSAALPENDATLLSQFDYKIANPDGELTAAEYSFKDKDLQIAIDSEGISFHCLRQLVETITDADLINTVSHYRNLVRWTHHVVPQVKNGSNPHIPMAAANDSHEDIKALLQR